MTASTLYIGRNLEDVAERFARITECSYRQHLEYWQATARDDRQEFAVWEEKKKTEPEKVRKKAAEKLLKLMGEYNERKEYCVRSRFFKIINKNKILINTKSGFYDDLLPKENMRNCFPVNVNYYIDVLSLTISKEHV